MSSRFTLTLLLPLSLHPHKPHPSLSLSTNPLSLSKTKIRCSLDREEQRWLREEQRWIREEQRWAREEQRWNRERDALLREIAELKSRLEESELSGNSSNTSVVGLLKGLVNSGNLIAESGSSSKPIDFSDESGISSKPIDFTDESGISSKPIEFGDGNDSVKEERKEVEGNEKKKKRRRRTLRVGAEGDEIREMQEALLKLGFYSGEDDMEYSTFSSGTESAVKTWQSTFGGHEDGIMTEELLERLYMEIEQLMGVGSDGYVGPKEGTSPVAEKNNNGAAIPSVTAVSEVQQKVVKEKGVTEYDALEHRVFLLGENRWEEPSRLAGRGKHAAESKANSGKTQCPTCRGEGRLLCMECDGTGEPNVEEQFLEWVDGDAKCPYCEGMGHTICDVCHGKKLM